jgi:carboxymethylenebutenolidase
LVLVSRTVGEKRVVDEMIVTMTHDREVPWILPGMAASGRRLEVAVLAVVRFVDGLITHEHLWWDQASVLVQLGLLPTAGLPVHGVEIAQRLRSSVSAEQVSLSRPGRPRRCGRKGGRRPSGLPPPSVGPPWGHV